MKNTNIQKFVSYHNLPLVAETTTKVTTKLLKCNLKSKLCRICNICVGSATPAHFNST